MVEVAKIVKVWEEVVAEHLKDFNYTAKSEDTPISVYLEGVSLDDNQTEWCVLDLPSKPFQYHHSDPPLFCRLDDLPWWPAFLDLRIQLRYCSTALTLYKTLAGEVETLARMASSGSDEFSDALGAAWEPQPER